MSLNSQYKYRFRGNRSLFLLLYAVCSGLCSYSFMLCAPVFVLTPLCCVLSAKAANTNSKVIELMRPTIQLTIYHRTRSIEIFNVTCFAGSSKYQFYNLVCGLTVNLDQDLSHSSSLGCGLTVNLDQDLSHSSSLVCGLTVNLDQDLSHSSSLGCGLTANLDQDLSHSSSLGCGLTANQDFWVWNDRELRPRSIETSTLTIIPSKRFDNFGSFLSV
jgi:hypothetical protein